MKRHVLILGCKNYPAFSSKRIISGGMEVYVTELVRFLTRAFDFTLIAGYSLGTAGVRVVSVPLIGGFALQPISLLVYSLLIAPWLALTGRRIDLVNAQTPLSGLVGLVLKKLFGIPYVVSVHIFASAEDHVGRLAGIYGAVEGVVLRRADRVIAAGNELKAFLDRRYGFPPKHVAVISPGMDFSEVAAGEASASIRNELEDDRFTLLFVGRLVAENGLLDLIDAMKMLRGEPVRLLIAGNGNLEGDLVARIERDGLADQIRMLGVVRGADKLFLIKHANVSIRTSYHEVFPVAYLESIAFGVPVIATPVGDTPYMADATGAITLVPVKQPQAVADAIRRHMQMGPLPAETVSRCRAFIESIAWRGQAQATRELYEDVIGRAERGRQGASGIA